MNIKIKEIGMQILLFLMLSIFAFGLSDASGGSRLFISDIVISIASVLAVMGIVLKRIKLNNKQKAWLIVIGIFITYLILASIINTLRRGFSQEYIVLIRNFYMSTIVLVFMSARLVKKNMIENVLIAFITYCNVYQFVQLYIHHEIRSSLLFFNVIVYAAVAQMLLVVLFKISSETKKTFKGLLANLNIFAIMFLMPFSGLRSGVMITYALVFCYVVYFTRFYGRKVIRNLFLFLFTVSLAIAGVIFVGNKAGDTRAINVLKRTLPLDFILKPNNAVKATVDIPTVPSQVNAAPQKTHVVDDGDVSDALRDKINETAIEQIKTSPLIGTGKLLMSVKRPSGWVTKEQPHGFLLGWLLGYGIIGTLLYIAFLLIPFYFANLRFRYRGSLFLFQVTLLGLFAISAVQPTMLRIITIQILLMIQILFVKEEEALLKAESHAESNYRKRKKISKWLGKRV